MPITRSLTQPGNFLPEAVELLSSEISLPLYDVNFRRKSSSKLRHPLGIYNVSLGGILDSFQLVLDNLEEILTISPDPSDVDYANQWESLLLVPHDRLLRLLADHIDDCFCVLMCFFESKQKYESDSHVNQFKKNMKCAYVNHTLKVVNHLKHHQGRLRFIVFICDNLVIPGYFVEGAYPRGVLGPAPQIHEKYKGRYTAFSFFRDIRYHFVGLYEVSSYLAQTLQNLLGTDWISGPIDNGLNEKIVGLSKRIEELPIKFFPDEVSMFVPIVKIFSRQNDTYLTLEQSTNFPIELFPSKCKIMVGHAGDGVSKERILPYWGDKK